jgi:DNA-directed RNA polymerase II subunit RPB2
MNIELDTWEVINSYFRDIPNYLVRHHIDSYNDFIQNKIPQIMKNLAKSPPYVLIDKEDRNITYEIKVFYGGKTQDRYKITKPTIINYPSGEARQLFPNEARLKDITYGADFFYDVDIEFTMKKGDEIILDKVPSPHAHILKNIYLGKIPIMLRSDLCVLSTANGEILRQMGEDKYDLGGYFILDGAEKVIVSQERKAENITSQV